MIPNIRYSNQELANRVIKIGIQWYFEGIPHIVLVKSNNFNFLPFIKIAFSIVIDYTDIKNFDLLHRSSFFKITHMN